MVGSGIGAEHGILIRSGEAIQTFKDVKTVIFDKTGTITKGKPETTDILPVGECDQETLIRLAASVELGSEHPLGRAIVEKAKASELELTSPKDFQAVRGKGVTGFVGDKHVLVGSRLLMKEYSLDPRSLENILTDLEDEAKTAMLVAIDGEILGVVAVADTLKGDSAAAIAALDEKNIKTVMITGDNKRTAEAIARRVGIDLVLAEVLPEGKVAEVQKLQSEDGLVAFVGDGINDAPALTQANVGVAIGTGTDIAIEASDVTLVRGELTGVVEAINLSQATFRKIKQNLFWAFFYNIAMIPLAVIGWMHPVLAEIAMAISSITVVGNANRLRKVNIKPDYEAEDIARDVAEPIWKTAETKV
jgi:Cu+-exporting ATPase